MSSYLFSAASLMRKLLRHQNPLGALFVANKRRHCPLSRFLQRRLGKTQSPLCDRPTLPLGDIALIAAILRSKLQGANTRTPNPLRLLLPPSFHRLPSLFPLSHSFIRRFFLFNSFQNTRSVFPSLHAACPLLPSPSLSTSSLA